jgi:signal transduction histidine kinase/ActR/RegA family two-component response regulator/ABC-type amino acid transport substrate-binding protein
MAAATALAEPEVRVGTYDFRPLMQTRAGDAGGGLFPGLLAEIARTEGWKIRLIPGSLEDGWARLAKGEIDILAAAPYTKSRTPPVVYSKESVFSTWAQVYVPHRQRLETVLELGGKTVAVCQNDPYAVELANLVGGFSITCTLVQCKSNADVLNAVSRKWVDAGVVDRLYGSRYERLYAVTRTPVLFAPMDLRFAAGQGQAISLLHSIDYALRKMKKEPHSAYYALVNHALDQETETERPEWPRLALAGLGALGLGAAWIIIRLRRQVVQTAGKLTEKEHVLKVEILSRRQAESNMLEFSQLLEKVFGTLHDGILVLDPKWQTIIRANPAATTMFEARDDDAFLATAPPDLFPSPETFAAFTRNVTDGIAKQGFARIDLQLSRHDRRLFPAEMVVSPVLDGQKCPICLVVVIRDTTAQAAALAALQESEKQLRHAQKMEALGTLAGGIAHDFNNLLMPILCGTEILLADEPPASPRQNELESIRDAGLRARDLIKQILLFSRPMEGDCQPLQVRPVMAEVLKFLRSTLPATVEIRKTVAAKNDWVLANPVHIHQVLLNLCTNAAHAMREKGGVLEVVLQNFNGTPHGIAGNVQPLPGRYIVLSICDTGHGMDPTLMERIFDPFFTTKKTGEGTGMGLSIVHGIVHRCGGCIAVESEVGRGSVFRVYLPATAPPDKTAALPAADPAAGTERLLIVDDEATLGHALKRSLERLGYQAVVCLDAAHALHLFRQTPTAFDRVISDQTMPGMTGTELARELRRIRPDMPIILCSGYSDMSLQETARQAGVQAFIHKPFCAKELAAVMQRLASQAPPPLQPACMPA